MSGGFLWGAGGSQLTPEEIALQRSVLARRKAQGVDVSPVASPFQGLARVADAWADRGLEDDLNQAAAQNATYNQSQAAPIMEALYGGITGTSSPVAAALTSAPGVAQEMAATSPAMDISGDQQQFVSALLPAAIEESKRTGVDPRIIVGQAALETGWGKSAPGNNYFGIKSHGQAGGNTMATTEVVNGQPVRIRDSFRAYESPADSVRGYGDFLLQNPRYEGLRNAQGLDGQLSALQASGYATDPNYGSKVGSIARGIQLPETPQAAIASAAPIGADTTISAPEALPALPARNVGATPSVASQPVQVAQNMPQVPRALIAQSLAVMQDPRATTQTKGVAEALLKRQQSYNETAQKQALAEQQRQQDIARRQAVAQQTGINPAYAQDPDIWKAAAGNVFAAPSTTTLGNSIIDNRTGKPIYQGEPQRQPLMNLGDGTVYDPNAPQDQRFIQAPGGNRGFRQATPDEVKSFGTNGQVGPDGKFYPITPPQGTSLSVDPQTGAVSFNQGAGVKPLTEGQSKDSFFTTRMTAATPTIDKFESALLSPDQAAADYVPGGRYYQSEEYQLAKDAGRDFVTAFLRKDSGAAISSQEEKTYGELLLPQPGDKPAILAAKRQRRQIATEAIKSGMPPSAVDGVLKAIQAVPGANDPAKTTKEINGYKIEEVH